MSAKINKTVKLILLFTGAGLLLSAAKIPILKADYYDAYLTHEVWTKTGIDSKHWYCLLIANVVLFSVGYFKNSLVFKIGYYLLLSFIAYVAIRFELLSEPNYHGTTREIGYYISITGSVLITIATMISLHRPYVKNVETRTDLLDSES